MENKSEDNELEPCRRCRKTFYYYQLKYDDEYLEEPVCRDCAGFRNCEKCGKKCDIKCLLIDKDNYFVCRGCEDREIKPCCRCKGIFLDYELNYVLNGNYACDTCEDIMEKEFLEQGEDYDFSSD
jgi:hypothetical protein